jgi:hypothetical protein
MSGPSEESCNHDELVRIGRASRTSMMRGQTPVSYLAKLVQRTEKAAKEAREFNKSILPDHQENLYLAGMNAIAEKFWNLARAKTSDPQEIRTYADLLHDHFEQKIKVQKNSIALRHLKLLEAKSKALTELAKDRSLTDVQFFGKIREVFFPAKNVNSANGDETLLLEKGLAP